MANIYRDSRSGDITVNTQEAPDQITDILDDRAKVQLAQPPTSDYRRLPGVNAGAINWLGSSYSGIDIKVVAHLYEAASVSEEIDDLRKKKDLYEALESGARGLLDSDLSSLLGSTSGKTYQQKRRDFEEATGLTTGSDEERQALNYLISNVFAVGNFSATGIGRIETKLRNMHAEFSRQRESIAQNISDLEEVRKEGLATVPLGTLQTLSVQSHREKYAVRALGHSYAKGYTRGPRTIGGTMIFTLFDEHSLAPLIRAMGRRESIWKDPEIATILPDQLPPIDITIVFANEYGSLSEMRIYGLEFVNDGMVMSIEDLLTEQTINFVARDCDVMTKLGKVRLSRLQRGVFDSSERQLSASDLLFSNERYLKYLDKLGVRRRRFNR